MNGRAFSFSRFWAVTLKEVGTLALAEMAAFLAVLFLGLIFAWKKEALVWE